MKKTLVIFTVLSLALVIFMFSAVTAKVNCPPKPSTITLCGNYVVGYAIQKGPYLFVDTSRKSARLKNSKCFDYKNAFVSPNRCCTPCGSNVGCPTDDPCTEICDRPGYCMQLFILTGNTQFEPYGLSVRKPKLVAVEYRWVGKQRIATHVTWVAP
jgi:hypothetical protein